MGQRTINLIDSKGRNANLFIINEWGRPYGTWSSRNPGMLLFESGSFSSDSSNRIVLQAEGLKGLVSVAILNSFWSTSGLKCKDSGSATINYGALLENDDSAKWVDD